MNIAKTRVLLIASLMAALSGCSSPFSGWGIPGLSAEGPTGAVGGIIYQVSCRNYVADPKTTTRELATSEPVPCEMLDNGKKYYRLGQYGLAEDSYRKAIQASARAGAALDKTAQMEMWLGLAATYDQLKRFDLADKAYAYFKMHFGETVAYQNNYGYSLLLRGEIRKGEPLIDRADSKMFMQ